MGHPPRFRSETTTKNEKRTNLMRLFSNRRRFLAIMVMALLLGVAAPTTSFGNDDHGRDRGRDNRDNRQWARRKRKCGKFVNCHDARDGRWDRRGPRGDRVANINPRIRVRRNRDFENDRFVIRNRRLHRDHANLFLRNRGRRFGRGAIVND